VGRGCWLVLGASGLVSTPSRAVLAMPSHKHGGMRMCQRCTEPRPVGASRVPARHASLAAAYPAAYGAPPPWAAGAAAAAALPPAATPPAFAMAPGAPPQQHDYAAAASAALSPLGGAPGVAAAPTGPGWAPPQAPPAQVRAILVNLPALHAIVQALRLSALDRRLMAFKGNVKWDGGSASSSRAKDMGV
jgi:hypothetical protein